MKTWNSEGHLTDLVLDLRAADDLEPQLVRTIDRHLDECRSCRTREAEWRSLHQMFATVDTVQPSAAFDDAVMARVRIPTRTAGVARWASVLGRLRKVAVGAAVAWSAAVIGGSVWFGLRADVSVPEVLGGMVTAARQLLWAMILRVGTIVEVTGLVDLWAEAARTVPGPGILSAVALMTAVSALALWTLYRVTIYQTSRVSAHV